MKLIITEQQLDQLVNKIITENYNGPDYRVWELFDENGKYIGLASYLDIIQMGGEPVLNPALYNLKNKGYTVNLIGNLYPLSQDSDNVELQKLKDKLKRKHAVKKGYKLDSKLSFGKHQYKTIKYIIDNDVSYMNWLKKEKVLLLHPEVEEYMKRNISESKILNESYNSITAYHGTNANIIQFTTDFVGGEKSVDSDGPGMYFTTDKEYAKLWGDNVYTVTLTPYILFSNKDKKNMSREKIVNLIKMLPGWEYIAYDWDENLQQGLNKSVKDILSQRNAKDMILQLFAIYYQSNKVEFLKNCSSIGIDGLIIERPEGPAHIVVYNPSIIHIDKIERI